MCAAQATLQQRAGREMPALFLWSFRFRTGFAITQVSECCCDPLLTGRATLFGMWADAEHIALSEFSEDDGR
jgi:hypothetical protein